MLKRIIVVTLIGTAVLAASSLSIVRAADNPLQGAWQVTNANGFAGIFIFAAKHYSMMAASTERPEITDLSKATADEVRAGGVRDVRVQDRRQHLDLDAAPQRHRSS